MVRGVVAPRCALPSMARPLRHVLSLHAMPIHFENAASLLRSSCTATGTTYVSHQLLEHHLLALEHFQQQIWAK